VYLSLISGGADGHISMWDLEAAEEDGQQRGGGGVATIHIPIGSVTRCVTIS